MRRDGRSAFNEAMSAERSQCLRFLAAFSFLIVAAIAPQSARPDQIPTNKRLQFEAALSLWLQDNDRESLPRLRELAREGSEPARQFIRLLKLRPDLWTPWLAGLSDEQRNAFFRPRLPGGPARGGWWHRGEEPEPIALLRSQPLEEPFVADMIRLIELGEPRLAFTKLASALRHKSLHQIATLAGTSGLPPELHFFLPVAELIFDPEQVDDLPSNPNVEGGPEARMQLALFYSWATFLMVEGDFAHQLPTETLRELITRLHKIAARLPYISAEAALADPEVAGKSAWPGRREVTLEWLETSPTAEHYRLMCNSVCPEEPGRCLLTAYFANDGYAALYGYETPSQTLVPSQRFRKSVRAQRMIVRRIANTLTATPGSIATELTAIRRGSRCLFREVSGALDRLAETEAD